MCLELGNTKLKLRTRRSSHYGHCQVIKDLRKEVQVVLVQVTMSILRSLAQAQSIQLESNLTLTHLKIVLKQDLEITILKSHTHK